MSIFGTQSDTEEKIIFYTEIRLHWNQINNDYICTRFVSIVKQLL